MPLLLYVATALALLWLAGRFVKPFSPLAALALLLLPLCFTGRAIFTGRVYGPIDLPYLTQPLNWMRGQYGIPAEMHNGALSDLAWQMIPWRAAVRDALAHHEWPLWDRFTLGGDVLAASAQPAAYSPFTLLACLLPPATSLTYSAAIWFFLAGLGAFLFARQLGMRESVSVIAAAGWMYATGVSFFILWPLGEAWTLLPLVLLGVRARSVAILTAALTLVILAGHPETVLHIVAVGAVYGVMSGVGWRVPAWAVLIAAGLTAIYTFPFLDAVPQTSEHEFRRNVQGPGATAQQSAVRLATDLLPFLHGRRWRVTPDPPPDSAAVGTLLLAAALFAIVRVRSREKWFFTGLLVFSLLAHAEWKPLAIVLGKIPLFDIALNERFSFAAAFSFVILASMGIEHLSHRGLAIACTIVLIVTAAASAAIPHVGSEYKVVADLIPLAAAALLFALRAPVRFAVAAFLGLLLVQRVMSDGRTYPVLPAEAAYPPIPILEPLRRVEGPFRITGHGRAFIPATSTFYGLEDVRGYAAMTLKRYNDTIPIWSVEQPVWFNRVDVLTQPFLSLLNVRYAITWDREPPREGWREVARQRGSVLLENERVLARAFVPRAIRSGFTDEETLRQMAAERDFAARGWIASAGPRGERPNPGRVLVIGPRKYGHRIVVEMDADGWVIVSEPVWRGWRAIVDDQPVDVAFADHAFLGIPVPKGRHTIRLTYWPRSFVIGRWVSLLTLLLLAGYSAASLFSKAAMVRSLR